jgi:hypothetical protein
MTATPKPTLRFIAQGFAAAQFGAAGDKPLPNAFVP